MLINKGYINKLFNDSAQISHGVDHLTLNLKDKINKLSNILSCLDTDNSNTQSESIDGYPITYTKSISKNGYYLMISIGINGVPRTIFEYLEYSDKKKIFIKSEGSFTFYSTYFRLLERGDLDLSFEKSFFGDDYKKVILFPISRIDYRVDFFFNGNYSFPDRYDLVNARKDTKNNIYTLEKIEKGMKIAINKIYVRNNKITGWDLGSRSNKTVFLRMYDKLLDSKIKGKVELYDDYFIYDNVYRLEGEFRTKFNKKTNKTTLESMISSYFSIRENRNDTPRNYNYGELHMLNKKCMSYFGLVGNKDKKFTYQYKENKNADLIDNRYYKDFTGRGCKIALNGGNPFSILLEHFTSIEKLRKYISDELLDNLILKFDQHKQSLISQKVLFRSIDKFYGDNSRKNKGATTGDTI